tara:strand:+ start:148 stop:387 length:240 start_codon:yes stop_codon:yes gene_type:complete
MTGACIVLFTLGINSERYNAPHTTSHRLVASMMAMVAVLIISAHAATPGDCKRSPYDEMDNDESMVTDVETSINATDVR